jgi:O-antigen/teichoic acid export membrane protein
VLTVIIGRTLQFALALILMRVATTLLSPTEVGRVSLVLTTIAFFALFLVNPAGMFINRRLHAWQSAGLAGYYLMRYAIYLLVVVFIAAIVLPFIYMIGVVDFGISIAWLTLLVCGSLFFNTINQTSIPSLNMLGESKAFLLLSVATIAASFLFAVFLVHELLPIAQYWLLGLLIGQALLAVYGTKILFAKLNANVKPNVLPSIQSHHLKKLFSFAWPVAISAGMGWLQWQGYRYIMDGQLGLAHLGLFAAGYGISTGIIAAFESVLTTYFQPRLYRDVNLGNSDQQTQAWYRYAATVMPPLILTVALIMILAPELTRVLLGTNFQSSANFVIWGALAESTRVLMGVYSLIAHVHMRTRWLVVPSLIGAALSIILSALLIPDLGAMGAGLALVVSGFTVVILMHIFFVRSVGGRMLLKPILMAFAWAGLLWGIAHCFRYLFNSSSWMVVFSLLSVVGLIYLGLQYLFLREYLDEKRNV